MHDSLTPIGGLVPLFLMLLGEITPGGVGAGLYGMLVFVLLAVFIAGLMVGRTPEYLGKKVEAFEMKMAMVVVLVLSASILGLHGARRRRTGAGQAGPLNAGPHGFSEILYAFTSQTGNNGSAFAGLTGQHALLQPHGRPRDADRAVRDDRPDPRDRRARSPPSGGVAPSPGTFPTTGPIFVGPADRRGGHRRRPQLLPRPRARPASSSSCQLGAGMAFQP